MKSRYQIQFSPSRLEAEKIRKLIQMPVTVDKEKCHTDYLLIYGIY